MELGRQWGFCDTVACGNRGGSERARTGQTVFRQPRSPPRPGSGFPCVWQLTGGLCGCLGTTNSVLRPAHAVCTERLLRVCVLPVVARPLLRPRGPDTGKCYLSHKSGAQPLRRARSVERPLQASRCRLC